MGLRWKLKRAFDLIVSSITLFLLSPVIAVAWILSSLETRSNGFFVQERVGLDGETFNIYKIKTMYPQSTNSSTITTSNDSRITRTGRILRKTKIDELPQLWNVLKGDMSLVGPRPDVPGYANKLDGKNTLILKVRPGITGPASLKYKNEEELLHHQSNPKKYNDEVIWPDKVKINIEYIENYSFKKDLYYLWKTIVG